MISLPCQVLSSDIIIIAFLVTNFQLWLPSLPAMARMWQCQFTHWRLSIYMLPIQLLSTARDLKVLVLVLSLPHPGQQLYKWKAQCSGPPATVQVPSNHVPVQTSNVSIIAQS